MFTSNIDPVLLHLGPVEIRYYGLAYILGFLLVWYVLHKRRDELKITKEGAGDIAFWLTVGTVVGARLYSCFVWYPSYYLAAPWKVFFVWEGGMAFHGGLIGIVVAAFWQCRKRKIPFLKFADVVAIPVVIGLAIGRIANFINGELYGPITTVPWCVKFAGVEGCRHPYQIYAALMRFGVAGILAIFAKQKHKDGLVFWMTVLLLGIGRTLLDFYRVDTLYAGLSIGQWSSIVMVLIAIYALSTRYSDEVPQFFKHRKN